LSPLGSFPLFIVVIDKKRFCQIWKFHIFWCGDGTMVRCSAVVLAKAEDLHYSLIEELSNSVKQTIAALSGYVSPSGVLIKH
jgi:hypothetical protein